MSDSDEYEVMEDQRFSPPSQLPMFPKQRANTHLGFSPRNRSPMNYDIDSRPPYPTPKISTQAVSNKIRSPILTETDNLTYDRITLSPVAPDYEYTSYPSASPPTGSNGYSHTRHNLDPPPLPPANPNRRPPPHRSVSESDQLSQTPPRSFTLPAHTNQLVNSGYYAAPNTRMVSYAKHKRSSSHEFEAGTSPPSNGGTPNPTYHSQSSNPLSGSSDCLLKGSRPESYVRDSAEMPLRVFAEKYKGELPLKVIVTKGFYGADERTSISERDMFNIHFFKQTKVVKIQDSSAYHYTVPLNSALEFGLVYTLPPGFKQPDSKFHFRSVKDLIQLKELPKVVRVTRAHRGSGPETSVEQHDLLLLKEVKQKRGLKSIKVLKAVHASTGAVKTLSEDCVGNFSVRPQDIRLFLPEIVEHIELPQTAICNYGGGPRIDLPAHIMSSEVKILNMQIEESIVATSILEDEATPSNQHYENTPSIPLVDIPTDLDIELAIIKLPEVDEDQLYMETRHVFERYNPANASYLNLKNSVTASAQTTLFRTIRQDQNQQVGIELLRPKNAFQTNSNLSLNRLSNGSDSSRRLLGTPSECANSEEVYSKLDLLSSTASSLETRLNKFELKLQSLERPGPMLEEQRREISVMKTDMGVVREDCNEFRKSIGDMKDSLDQLKATSNKLSMAIEAIQSNLQQLQERHHSNGSLPNGLVNGKNGHNEEHNIHSIQKLNHSQVLQLLSVLKLTQYNDAFISEEITGEILAELNEADLQNELGITSKIHRVKLMKVISGRHSALNVLRGEDPYYVHLSQLS